MKTYSNEMTLYKNEINNLRAKIDEKNNEVGALLNRLNELEDEVQEHAGKNTQLA
jgi:uncharacterized coiled-coil DUF342 family protein